MINPVKITTSKQTKGFYKVNEIDQEVTIEKLYDGETWKVYCDELSIDSAWDSKKECVSYIESIINEGDNYIGFKVK